ncbi:hypothetical protein ACFOYW_15315 [Gryllotalpicola reticulitermitis]|uniref:DUF2188 domain-containing protein n=1 Tax=Gryllotalpicola reticulitermitis TaxID=1184153 RepID=A0ABV8Q9W0_9MICO
MSAALSFWRSYDKHGHAFYSATVRGTGSTIAIAQESAAAFALELNGTRLSTHARLADAKRAADALALRVTAEHHDRMIREGVMPPEMFEC